MSPGQALKMTGVPIQRENVDSKKEDDAKRHSEEGSLCSKERGRWENPSSYHSEETEPL